MKLASTLEDFQKGQVLLFDKPLHWTSFQLVNKVRWLIKKKFQIKKLKVGHAGTLDPLATGLVIICTGKMTKQIESFMGQTKVYTGEFTLGATTPSYDLETEIDQSFDIEHINEALIQQTTQQFIGKINQKPPIFSALKKEGKRLYEYARSGEEVEIPSRKVFIKNFQITKIDFPKVEFEVTCSKGTYIRSLAHDFGKALHAGAHLSALKRTKIGEFKVENALHLEDFENKLTN
ncbi:tRNA pseudouridine(55) synthase TruB [Psychroflexus salis]|uniref:tRNA pseudouridine synthase B n=1 Tax=Psychroflexus salis TaxID=1526574 RepID=A0A917E8E4_9FLAO|nr:tRNA pseudouridine(55) synthase TruB [Psychroflexus salis]GGE09381.1 tRNA pseudouridine synthase B [Psychroflexus salis]